MGLTTKTYSEKNAKQREKERREKENLELILKYLTESKDTPSDILDACKIVRPSFFGIGGTRSKSGLAPAYEKLAVLSTAMGEKIKEGLIITALDFFESFAWGKYEITVFIRDLIKEGTDENRVFIEKTTEKEYKIIQIGGDYPPDWQGYRVKIKDTEK